MMEIESSVPLPLKPSEVLSKMEIGDSAFDEGSNSETSKLFAVARKQPKRTGKKFTARSVDGGLRIWRTA